MKACFLTLASVLLVSFSLKAQKDSTHIRELGMGLSSLSSFNLAYQWGTPKTLFRFSAASISFSTPKSSWTTTDTTSYGSTNESDNPDISVNLFFTILRAVKITDRFDFIWGPLIGVGISYNDENNTQTYTGSYLSNSSYDTKTTSYSEYIGLAIGARYAIGKSFFVYAEIDPRFFNTSSTSNETYLYKYNSTQTYGSGTGHNTSSSYGISNLSDAGASITFVYRWFKK